MMTDENGGCCDGGRMWWCGVLDDGESSERGRERLDGCGVGWRSEVGDRSGGREDGGGMRMVVVVIQFREKQKRTGKRVCSGFTKLPLI
ncbi:hypothetical protein MtrunA17_Chr6g0459731 [Medicago truncatula]|uniref:Uncharacterized protein n=1 Tax=Medicago truncatula TaxID=3880 RepID=A0A072U7Y2_MEDTR|nr:hypothetical protein MTR_6g024090 [Medicago truncatula]RHN50647.1 hypothetical protein MtrunA17_Chr6g0459731 [Medicago truncatula]